MKFRHNCTKIRKLFPRDEPLSSHRVQRSMPLNPLARLNLSSTRVYRTPLKTHLAPEIHVVGLIKNVTRGHREVDIADKVINIHRREQQEAR